MKNLKNWQIDLIIGAAFCFAFLFVSCNDAQAMEPGKHITYPEYDFIPQPDTLNESFTRKARPVTEILTASGPCHYAENYLDCMTKDKEQVNFLDGHTVNAPFPLSHRILSASHALIVLSQGAYGPKATNRRGVTRQPVIEGQLKRDLAEIALTNLAIRAFVPGENEYTNGNTQTYAYAAVNLFKIANGKKLERYTALHFLGSSAATIACTELFDAPILCPLAVVAAGWLKERTDKRFSDRDFAADIAGAGFAVNIDF